MQTSSEQQRKRELAMKREGIAFAISLNAIRINLLGLFACLCALGYVVVEPVDFDFEDVNWLAWVSSPIVVSLIIDSVLMFAFFTPIKPFEFLQFKAFASAGFFAYLAYCSNASILPEYIVPIYYVLLGLLTRRLGITLSSVVALVSFCALGFAIWQRIG